MRKLILVFAVVFCAFTVFAGAGCDSVEQKVSEIKASFNQAMSTIEQLQEISDEISVALEEAEAKADELQSALDEADAKLDEFDAMIDDLKSENAQLRKEINCLKNIHFAKDATYEWSGNSCTATGVCEICGVSVTETVTAVEVEGVLTATFSLSSGFVAQVYTPAE